MELQHQKDMQSGEVAVQVHRDINISNDFITDVEAEKMNFMSAVGKTKEQLKEN